MWWTFAGWRANLGLAQVTAALRHQEAAIDDLTVALDPGTTVADRRAVLDTAAAPVLDTAAAPVPTDLAPWITAEPVDGLKFSDCLPHDLATAVVTQRLQDTPSVALALAERIDGWHGK